MPQSALVGEIRNHAKALGLAAAVIAATLAAPVAASADTLLDNGLTPYGSYTIVSNFVFQMMPGMPGFTEYQTGQVGFNSGADNTLTSFTVTVQNRGSESEGDPSAGLVAGIMADNGSGAPTGVFLDETTLYSPIPYADAPITVSGLDWQMAPNTNYWLELQGESGADYAWLYSSDGSSYATVINADDVIPSGGGNGNADVPEPASLALFGFGVLGLGLIRRVRTRGRQRLGR
jgi:hypothetical protein